MYQLLMFRVDGLMMDTREFHSQFAAFESAYFWAKESEGNYWNIVYLKTGGWDGS